VIPEQVHHKRLIKGSLILLICGVLYYCFVKITGIGIPCLFRLVTGLKCPGCGVSTMILALTEGDIRSAFIANRFLLVTLPFLLFEIVFAVYLYWLGKRQPKWNNVLLIVYLIVLLLFGLLRNLTGFGW